ncbi:MAG: phage DNA encapsidation protein [Mycoplasmoidaceae bacterium]
MNSKKIIKIDIERKPKSFFNIEDYINLFNEHFKLDSFSRIIIIHSERNIGKTLSTWKYAEKVSMKSNKKIVCILNKDVEITFFRQGFNSIHKNKFEASSKYIYKLEPTTLNGKTIYKRGDLVGYIISLSCWLKYKPNEFKNVNLVFFDNYNGINQFGQFEDFISVFKKWKNNNLEIILLGEKNGSSKFLEKFKIGALNNKNKEYDLMIGIITELDETEVIGAYFEIGSKTYEDLGNDKTLMGALAKIGGRDVF